MVSLSNSCVIIEDFNVHSLMWNPLCTGRQRRSARFLEALIRAFDLQVLNYDSATRPGASGGIHSTIDLTLAAPGAGPSCKDWSVVDREVHASPSDHVMIERKWVGRVERLDSAWEIKGWAVEEKLEKEKEGERSGTRVLITLAVAWSLKSELGQGPKRPSRRQRESAGRSP